MCLHRKNIFLAESCLYLPATSLNSITSTDIAKIICNVKQFKGKKKKISIFLWCLEPAR